jgi:hypothetical protein
MAEYRILRTSPSTYQAKNGRPVSGFQVEVFLPEFDEEHIVNAPSLDPEIIKPEIEKLIEQRKQLASLGG